MRLKPPEFSLFPAQRPWPRRGCLSSAVLTPSLRRVPKPADIADLHRRRHQHATGPVRAVAASGGCGEGSRHCRRWRRRWANGGCGLCPGCERRTLGTAFLRCEEANVFDAHRAAVREPTDACTVVTDVITGRPARNVKNGLIDDLVASELRPVAFPGQFVLPRRLGARETGSLQHCLPVNPRHSPATPLPARWSTRLRKRRQNTCAFLRVVSPHSFRLP